MKKNIEELKSLSVDARKLIIEMAASEVGCHIGGSLSVVDILLTVYKLFGDNPENKIILSKGHAAAALYSVLYTLNYLKENPATVYGKNDSLFTGHPNHKISGISFSTGSLGHGLGYGAGWALASKMKKTKGLSIVISGDGELQEGSCWEALQVISSKKIANLVYIVDRNHAQNDGLVDAISPYHDLFARFQSFGVEVVQVNGHRFDELIEAIESKADDKALVIIAETKKGKGIRALENNSNCHYAKIKKAQSIKWKKELDGVFR